MGFSIKQWLYNRKLHQKLSSLGKPKVPAQNPGNTIALVYSDDDDLDTIRQLKKELKQQHRRTFDLIFKNEKVVVNPESEPETFSAKNINWYGWPNSTAIEVFQRQHYDILLLLNTSDVAIFHHLLKTTSAHLKIGYTTYADNLHLIIDGEGAISTKELIQRIKSTLQALQPRERA